MKMIEQAIQVAVKAHQNQSRKGTDIPYVTHPLSVGMILAKGGRPDGVIIAGILHDTVEDTQWTLAELRNTFGESVAAIVEGASEPDKSLPWEERKRHTLDFLRSASEEIRWVTLADKLDNIRAISADYGELGERLWDRFRRGREAQKWYYEGLGEALRPGSADGSYAELYNEFAQKVMEIFGENS